MNVKCHVITIFLEGLRFSTMFKKVKLMKILKYIFVETCLDNHVKMKLNKLSGQGENINMQRKNAVCVFTSIKRTIILLQSTPMLQSHESIHTRI